MATTPIILSGSTNGKAIKVAATSTPGTTIHQAVSGTSSIDRIWLYAVNTSNAAVKLTIEWGETSAPDGNIELTIPPESGPIKVVDGFYLQNSLTIGAFAGTGDVITIHGRVLRYS